MKITYDLTKELKGDLGYSSNTEPICLESIEELKEQIAKDYSAEDYRIAILQIRIDDRVEIDFDYPCRTDICYLLDDRKIRLAKFDIYKISDLIHNLEEYARYEV